MKTSDCGIKDSFLCSALYINDCPFSFVLPALALQWVSLNKQLMQKRVYNFKWLDHIQCEKKMCIIFNLVQLSLKNASVILHQTQMKKNKLYIDIAIAAVGPMIVTGHCEIN